MAAKEHAPVTIEGDMEPAPENRVRPKKALGEYERLSMPAWLEAWDRPGTFGLYCLHAQYALA